MENVYLYRMKQYPDCFISRLCHRGKFWWVIEPPWRNNERNISCIPSGTYSAKHLPRSASGKYKNVYWIQDVPNRSGILIHAGNFPKHTLGCMLPGIRRGMHGNSQAVWNSKTALDEFVTSLNKQPFNLLIFGNQHEEK